MQHISTKNIIVNILDITEVYIPSSILSCCFVCRLYIQYWQTCIPVVVVSPCQLCAFESEMTFGLPTTNFPLVPYQVAQIEAVSINLLLLSSYSNERARLTNKIRKIKHQVPVNHDTFPMNSQYESFCTLNCTCVDKCGRSQFSRLLPCCVRHVKLVLNSW